MLQVRGALLLHCWSKHKRHVVNCRMCDGHLRKLAVFDPPSARKLRGHFLRVPHCGVFFVTFWHFVSIVNNIFLVSLSLYWRLHYFFSFFLDLSSDFPPLSGSLPSADSSVDGRCCLYAVDVFAEVCGDQWWSLETRSRSRRFQVSSRSRRLQVSVTSLLPWDFEYFNDGA